jgi:NADH:ubiquinone oxidoreductase subunit C
MTILENIPAELELTEHWEQKGGSHWLAPESLDVRKLTKLMNAHQARFITITATELPEHEGILMDYQMDSIYDLCEAADWIEREIHEYYAVDFVGRDYEPLMLREGDKAGVNLREEEE